MTVHKIHSGNKKERKRKNVRSRDFEFWDHETLSGMLHLSYYSALPGKKSAGAWIGLKRNNNPTGAQSAAILVLNSFLNQLLRVGLCSPREQRTTNGIQVGGKRVTNSSNQR